MTVWRVLVEYADGDDWSAPRQWSHVEVAADDEREARLVGTQLALTPRREKPSHVQTTGISPAVRVVR